MREHFQNLAQQIQLGHFLLLDDGQHGLVNGLANARLTHVAQSPLKRRSPLTDSESAPLEIKKWSVSQHDHIMEDGSDGDNTSVTVEHMETDSSKSLLILNILQKLQRYFYKYLKRFEYLS